LCQQARRPINSNQDTEADLEAEQTLRRTMHKAIRRVTEDIEAFKFNTAVAAMMEFSNSLRAHLEQKGPSSAFQEATNTLIRLLAPFAPHIAEELWARRGGELSVHRQPWPVYEPALTVDETITLAIQVNGKVRDRVAVPAGISEEEVRQRALESEQVGHYLDGKVPKQVIVVPGRLVNVVV
jgi:leucyl-tRNA synthetase